jgi:ATP-dependent 26S proteasome regulatory subunit
MTKKILVLVLVVVVIFLTAGMGLLILTLNNYRPIQKAAVISEKSSQALENGRQTKADKLKELEVSYNKDFPDVVTGIINIISDQKTTIKNESGVEYLISPPRAKSFFSGSGIKNGNKVEVRGKFMGENIITLASIVNKK